MLTLSHIRKDYGKFTAVEDINLELENGLYAMLAPNGAGKTTLIKMITTLLYPTSGEILYDGMDIYKMGETYRDVIGYLPQHFGYYKNNTPTQYLDYLAALKGISKEAAKEKIPELLELVGLSDVLGLFGVIAPTTSAFLHNASTMAICAKSMTPVLKKPSDNKENETEEETA